MGVSIRYRRQPLPRALWVSALLIPLALGALSIGAAHEEASRHREAKSLAAQRQAESLAMLAGSRIYSNLRLVGDWAFYDFPVGRAIGPDAAARLAASREQLEDRTGLADFRTEVWDDAVGYPSDPGGARVAERRLRMPEAWRETRFQPAVVARPHPRILLFADRPAEGGGWRTLVVEPGFASLLENAILPALDGIDFEPCSGVGLELVGPHGDRLWASACMALDAGKEVARAAARVWVRELVIRVVVHPDAVTGSNGPLSDAGLALRASLLIGAMGLLLFGSWALLARAESLARGVRAVDPSSSDPGIPRIGATTLDPEARKVWRDGVEVHLRPKEFELLAALVARRGKAVSRDALLDEVWGYDASVESRTVDWHVAELRKKLEADPANPELIRTVRGFGYRLDG